MPEWYGAKCSAISRALHRRQITKLEAALEIERWHPIALRALRETSRASRGERAILADCERLVAEEGARWAGREER
jgi:hypothetical protein